MAVGGNGAIAEAIEGAFEQVLTVSEAGERENVADGLHRIARALTHTLQSPNVSDNNMEPANVVDALDSIAKAIDRLALAVEGLQK